MYLRGDMKSSSRNTMSSCVTCEINVIGARVSQTVLLRVYGLMLMILIAVHTSPRQSSTGVLLDAWHVYKPSAIQNFIFLPHAIPVYVFSTHGALVANSEIAARLRHVSRCSSVTLYHRLSLSTDQRASLWALSIIPPASQCPLLFIMPPTEISPKITDEPCMRVNSSRNADSQDL